VSAGITQRGFQFLLADLYSQLWGVVRQYLSGLEAQASDGAGGGNLAVAINFLLCLGLQEGCNVMCHGQLGNAEKAIAAHMCQLGLLLPVAGGGELWLHPTRLAAVLAGGGRGGEAVAAQEDGYVIVESNFRWAVRLRGRTSCMLGGWRLLPAVLAGLKVHSSPPTQVHIYDTCTPAPLHTMGIP
jgi:transcription initiation factor TFIIH subunit 4